MLEKSIVLIVNPKAGKCKGAKQLGEITQAIQDQGYLPTVLMTHKYGDASRFAYEYGNDAEVICCVGGDGTFSEVVAGMVAGKHSVPIGYIPAGSTNDYIEVINNAHSMAEVNAKSILWWEDLTLQGERLAACAGMDLHDLTDMSMKFATYAEGTEGGDAVSELHAAISQQKTWVSKGMLVTWTIENRNICFRLQDVNKPGFIPADRYMLTLKKRTSTRAFDVTSDMITLPLSELENIEIPKLYGGQPTPENLICIAPTVRQAP